MRVLVLLGLIACGQGTDTVVEEEVNPTSSAALDASAEAEAEVLLGEAYRFCHDANVDIEEVRPWCDLVVELDAERCPGLVQTCASDETVEASPPASSGCNEGSGGTEAADEFAAPEPPPPPKPEPWDMEFSGCSCEAPESMLGMIQAVLAVAGGLLIALLLAVVVRLIVLAVMRRQQAEAPATTELLEAVEEEAIPDVPDLPSADLLGAAKRALDAGLLDEAVLLARSAALRSLGDAGRVKLHRSRTDREYVRMVRGDGEIYGPLREIFRAVERVRWGGVSRPSSDKVRAVFQAAERILKVAGVVLLVGLLTAASGTIDRYGAHGDAAIHELYADYGYDAHWRLRPIAKLNEKTDVLVLDLTHIALLEGDAEVLRRWTGDGGILVVAGDASEVFPELGSVVLVDPLDIGVSAGVDSWLDPVRLPGFVYGWSGGTGRTWVWAIDRSTGGLTASVSERPALVQAMSWGAGGIVALGDGRLLSNVALIHPANEQVLGLAPVVGEFTSMWRMDEVPRLEIASMNAASAESPMQSISNAQLLPLVLQLLVLALVAAAWKGIPFRPLRDPPDEGRLSFSEHVLALGTHYSRRGGSKRAASAYANLLLTVSGKRALEESARRSGLSSEQASELVARAEHAAQNPDDEPDPKQDLTLMEDLWKIDPTR